MHVSEVKQTLQANRAILEEMGVRHLEVFGSVARGDSHAGSDIDLRGEWDSALSLTDLENIRLTLESMLGASVDLTDKNRLKPRIRERSDAEAVLAF